ncbi:MAG: DUF5688 family protein [Lachnospiraceae bacterium]|nr:DUF5688 family protein [Lachnospiraceae bacterium]
MKISDFAIKVKIELQSVLGDEYLVDISENCKMNGVKKWAVTIHKDSNIAPTIYLEAFYKRFIDGEDFETVINSIIMMYRESAPSEDIDMSDFMQFELIKDKICFKLCNTEKNMDILEKIPSVPFYDLSVVFYVLVTNELFGSGQVLIRNEHMQLWNTSVSELMSCARNNTPKLLNIKLSNIIDVMKNILSRNDSIEAEDIPDLSMIDRDDCFMWVLSNDDGFNGAASILYPNVMDDIYEVIGKNFFVIPSSVHELIVVPDKEGIEGDDTWNHRCSQLRDMIHQVNEEEVPESDILSDNLYYYNADDKVFKLVPEERPA